MTNIDTQILRTLIYAQIFDYPLTESEIWRFLIGKKTTLKFFRINLNKLLQHKKIIQKFGFYALKNKQKIINIRISRRRLFRKKYQIAQKAALMLKMIPTVWFVGITGSLAMSNSKSNDDIDLMIITAPNTLWLTRFAANILLDLLRMRRRATDIYFKNKICLNMFFDSQYVSLPIKERDLYSAHEIAQVKPLLNRHLIYELFIQKNLWTTRYLPQALVIPKREILINREKNKFIFGLNKFTKFIQLISISKRVTTEIISDKYLRFHPKDARSWILSAYQKIIDKKGLDKTLKAP